MSAALKFLLGGRDGGGSGIGGIVVMVMLVVEMVWYWWCWWRGDGGLVMVVSAMAAIRVAVDMIYFLNKFYILWWYQWCWVLYWC